MPRCGLSVVFMDKSGRIFEHRARTWSLEWINTCLCASVHMYNIHYMHA